MENEHPYCPACDCGNLRELEKETMWGGEMHEHHIHPRFMGNKEGKGEKVRISKKKHYILHGKIMRWLWQEIKKEDEEKVIRRIIKLSKKFVGDIDGHS